MPVDLPELRDEQFRHMRGVAREIFSSALKNASIESAFARNVHCERRVLRIGDDLYHLDSYSRVFVVSMGKAAHTMAAALEAQVGSSLEGIVAASVEPASHGQIRGFRYFRGGHPTPTAESIQAGAAILKSLTSLDAASLVIFMISGGGSSIVEKPVDEEISLYDLAATYRALVHSGAPIAEINAIRKHISAVKGGRLALAASGRSGFCSRLRRARCDARCPSFRPNHAGFYPCGRLSKDCREARPPADQFQIFGAGSFSRQRSGRNAQIRRPRIFVRSRWWTILSNKSAVDDAAGLPCGLVSPSKSITPATTGPTTAPPSYLLDRLLRVA